MIPSKSASSQPNQDIPEKCRGWTLDDYNPAIWLAVRPFIDGANWSLYLHGATGSRKSCLAAAVMLECRARGLSPIGGYHCFVEVEAFEKAARNFDEYGKNRFAAWRDCPLLVLDDVNMLRNTPHIVEYVLMLTMARYSGRRRTILTSNQTLPELAQHFDPRLASRLQEGVLLDMGDKDWRKQPVFVPGGSAKARTA